MFASAYGLKRHTNNLHGNAVERNYEQTEQDNNSIEENNDMRTSMLTIETHFESVNICETVGYDDESERVARISLLKMTFVDSTILRIKSDTMKLCIPYRRNYDSL